MSWFDRFHIGKYFTWKKEKKADDEIFRSSAATPEDLSALQLATHRRLMRVEDELLRQKGSRIRRTAVFLVLIAGLIGTALYFSPASDVEVKKKAFLTLPVSAEGSGTARVIVLTIDDVIGGHIHGDQVPGNTVRYVHEALEWAAKEKNVTEIILYLDTPGGGAAASAQIYNELMRFRKTTGKEITAYVPEAALSGGYYIACAASQIVTASSAFVGSIGVITRRENKHRQGQRKGIEDHNTKSGPSKDAFSQWTKPHPDDDVWAKANIDDSFELFLEAVAKARNLDLETLKNESQVRGSRTSGAYFTARIAKRHGLIDAFVNEYYEFLELRAEAMKKTTKFESVEFIEYTQKNSRTIMVNTAPGAKSDVARPEFPEEERPRLEWK